MNADSTASGPAEPTSAAEQPPQPTQPHSPSPSDARRISGDEVRKVARLARLSLSDTEVDQFSDQLSDILDHASDLDALNLDGIEPLAHPLPLVNVFRADVPGEPLDRAKVLASAPASENGQFRVPPVLGEEI